DGMWQFVPGGGVLPPWWTPLQPSPTRDTAGLVVGDFDGDGISDIARRSATSWDVSRNARDPFVSRATSDVFAVLGRFSGFKYTDALLWTDRTLTLAFGATDFLIPWGRQDLR